MTALADFEESVTRVPTSWFVTRFVADGGVVHEVECRDGRAMDWRREVTDTAAPVLDLRVEGPLSDHHARVLPFVEDPYLHGRLSSVSDGAAQKMFPFAVANLPFAPELYPRLAMLWIVHDGPFGKFGWRNVFVDGRCEQNDIVSEADVMGTTWDAVAEVDYVDVVACFLGDLEIRDLIDRGHLKASIAALSALSWVIERDESVERAREQRAAAELLCDWIAVARRDEVLAWASAFSTET